MKTCTSGGESTPDSYQIGKDGKNLTTTARKPLSLENPALIQSTSQLAASHTSRKRWYGPPGFKSPAPHGNCVSPHKQKQLLWASRKIFSTEKYEIFRSEPYGLFRAPKTCSGLLSLFRASTQPPGRSRSASCAPAPGRAGKSKSPSRCCPAYPSSSPSSTLRVSTGCRAAPKAQAPSPCPVWS